MTLIAVIGNACTTTSLALASRWPTGQAVLAELDRSGGDLTAWCDLPSTPGLASLVSSTPSGGFPPVQTHLRSGPGSSTLLTAPIRAVEAEAVIREACTRIVPTLVALGDLVIADCGRQQPRDLHPAVTAAHLVVVTIRQAGRSWRGVAAELDRTAELIDQLQQRSMPVVVAVIGDRPYEPAEIARFLGTSFSPQVTCTIAEDPGAAAALANGALTDRRVARSRLMRTAIVAAAEIHNTMTELFTPIRWGAA